MQTNIKNRNRENKENVVKQEIWRKQKNEKRKYFFKITTDILKNEKSIGICSDPMFRKQKQKKKKERRKNLILQLIQIEFYIFYSLNFPFQ